MGNEESILNQDQWRVIDQSSVGRNASALQSFAADDALCHSVGQGQGQTPPVVRTWVHAPTVVLGIQDSRLPHLEAAVDFLEKEGYQVVVRNSGGLAVVLDEGVLNISLILSEKENRIDINKGYDAMVQLISGMFREFGAEIQTGEVIGSYCPGSYDLSIQGKKFAGISQRRIRGGVAVQIYLCMDGSGSERAELIKKFYTIGKAGVETKFAYPDIKPEVMASLSELLEIPISAQDGMLLLLKTLKKHTDYLDASPFTAEEASLFESYLLRIQDRSRKALEK